MDSFSSRGPVSETDPSIDIYFQVRSCPDFRLRDEHARYGARELGARVTDLSRRGIYEHQAGDRYLIVDGQMQPADGLKDPFPVVIEFRDMQGDGTLALCEGIEHTNSMAIGPTTADTFLDKVQSEELGWKMLSVLNGGMGEGSQELIAMTFAAPEWEQLPFTKVSD